MVRPLDPAPPETYGCMYAVGDRVRCQLVSLRPGGGLLTREVGGVVTQTPVNANTYYRVRLDDGTTVRMDERQVLGSLPMNTSRRTVEKWLEE